MNTTSHTRVSRGTKRLLGIFFFFLPLGGRGGGESRPEWNILIIVLMPASPPPRVGPPSGRGSTPSHSVGAAHCVWRTHTGWQITPVKWGEMGGGAMGNKIEKRFRERQFPDGYERTQNKRDDTQRTNTRTKEEFNRWEWAKNDYRTEQSKVDRNSWTEYDETVSDVQWGDKDEVNEAIRTC